MDISVFLMLTGFLAAAYSVLWNDSSLQIFGPLFSSNPDKKWYVLWFGAVVILWGTVWASWYIHSGDIAWERLSEVPRPAEFNIFHLLAPLALLVLTKFRVPVSTTFLVLTLFTLGSVRCDLTTLDGCGVFEKMLMKSFIGYGVALFTAGGFWWVLSFFYNEQERPTEKYRLWWFSVQWVAVAYLWSVWLMHDMANIAVYMPRQMTAIETLLVLGVVSCFLAHIFYRRGGEMKEIVLQKESTKFVRNTTIISIFYAFLLLFFKEINEIPMSTTWVFVGLLAGRNWAIDNFHPHPQKKKKTGKQILYPLATDLGRISIGLAVSVLIALTAAGIL